MKTKTKNVPMLNAVITKTSRGGYFAQGTDKDGNKMCAMMNEATAFKHIKEGAAKKAF
jgi:hypothetical protein